jgi:curved DNA-binding protein CbpA
LDLSPTYSNARILQAESHFELYSFAKCLNAIQSIPKDVCETNDKIKNMKVKALQQKNMTHYQILGLSGPPSSEADIKKAYRKQSMKWHPDKHQQNKDSKARATTTFKRLNEANQVLSDTYAKMMYDSEIEINMAKNHYGHRSGGGSSSSSSSSSSSNVYGGYNSGSSRRSSTTEPREGVHRTTYDSTGRSRRASAPPSSQEKDVGSRDSSYYSQSNYADRQQQRRRQEEDPLNEPNVLSDTDEEDDEDDYDDEDEGDLMSNMAAWRKADVLDSMEYDDDELDGGGYSYSAYE